MQMEIDLVNAKQIEMSPDLYYLLKDGEEPLIDMDAPKRADEIHQMFPMGVCIQEDRVELPNGDIRVTVATYREVEDAPNFDFDYDFEYVLTNDLTLEVKWGPGRKSVQTRFHQKGKVPYDYRSYDVKETKIGKPYFQTEFGSIFWLVDKFMRIKK